MGLTVSLEVQLQLAGLPEPMLDQFRHNPSRKWRWDLAWPDHASRLLVDIQGGVYSGGKHVRGKGITNDLEKMADAVCMGFKVLLVTPEQVASGQALAWVKKLLEAT